MDQLPPRARIRACSASLHRFARAWIPPPHVASARGSTVVLLAVAFALLLAASAPRAAVIAAWNFNGPLTGTLLPAVGDGRLDPVGVGASLFASGEAGGGSSDPVVGNPPDYAWQVSGFPQQGTAAGSAGIQARVDTSGFAAIAVAFDFRGSAGSARHQQFQVTLDGSRYFGWGDPVATTSVDPWTLRRRFDLSALPGASDNPLFGFRVVSAFAPGTSSYQAVQAASAYSTAGAWRFDMLVVTGEPLAMHAPPAVVPLPPSGVLLAGGLLVGLGAWRGAGRRRRGAAAAL